MNLQVLTVLVTYASSAVYSCPYKQQLSKSSYEECLMHHSITVCETLVKHPNYRSARKLQATRSISNISLKNNGILSPVLKTFVFSNLDLVDIVSRYASGVLATDWGKPPDGVLGKDMCMWNFQSIPPPPDLYGNNHISSGDAEEFWSYCKSANDKFQAEIGKHDGSVVFGGCTLGFQGAIDLISDCTDKAREQQEAPPFCDSISSVASKSSIIWPQAVYMFKVRPSSISNNSALKAFLSDWRSLEKYHSQHINWVVDGSNGGNNGGSKQPDWGAGAGPGVFRKIIPCEAINQKYMYPSPFPIDAPNAGNTTTIMDDAYQHWQSLCSVLPWYSQSDCAATPPLPQAESSIPMCNRYVHSSIMCSQEIYKFGKSSTQEVPDTALTTALLACAKDLCAPPWNGDVVQVRVIFQSLRSVFQVHRTALSYSLATVAEP
jgi:hypothetical protein